MTLICCTWRALKKRVERYEEENRKLTEGIESIGTDYNHMVSTCGWLEERNAELESENKRLKEILREVLPTIPKNRCSICDVEMLSDACKARTDGRTCFKWKYEDEVRALIGGEENDT